MSQATAAIANISRTLYRAAVNACLQAIQSNNSGLSEPTETYAYMFWADTTLGLLKQRNAANNAWIVVSQLSNWAVPSVQSQAATAFTTGGTTTAYTLTPLPAVAALAANQRWRVKFNAANGATPTLAVSGLTAKSLKVYDSTGAKADPAVGALAANMLADVEYDGTDYVVLNQLPAAVVPGVSEKYVYIREQQTSGTSPGTFTSGAWRTRTLNTEVNDSGNLATLASNQVTLLAGTYRFRGRAPAYKVDGHKCKLINVTDTIEYIGSNAFCDSAQFPMTDSVVEGRFTIAGTKVFELQHRSQGTRATDGFGIALSLGVVEVYATLEFWKEL